MAVVAVDLQALVKGLDGLRRIFLQHIDLSTHRVAAGVFGPSGQHGVKLRLSLVVILGTYIAERAVVPKSLVLRIILQRAGIVGDSLHELIEPDAAKASQLVGVGDIGIAFYSTRTVVLGSGNVVKIILGHTAEEPRLVQIRLGRDGLVEILDGKDIVLIIEG